MKPRGNLRLQEQRGFSMVELLVVMAMLTVMLGAIFSLLSQAQQRMTTEQAKLDYNSEVRDFVDQFFRDINQIGDPNPRMFDTSAWSTAPQSPVVNDHRIAAGLVKIDANEIRFEGSVNGIGTVQTMIYKLNGSGTCSYCLQRSQIDKQDGSPVSGQNTPNWGTEVNDVQTNPIFVYYDTAGNQITGLPLDISSTSNAQIIATVKTIHISLQVRDPLVIDPQTGQPIEGTFEGEVSLNNCAAAATGYSMSCQ